MSYNNKVSEMQQLINSEQVANCNSTSEIVEILLSNVRDILSDNQALNAAKEWDIFSNVLSEHDFTTGKKYYKQMSIEESFCTQLWMYVYH